jgi:hypothetical protein
LHTRPAMSRIAGWSLYRIWTWSLGLLLSQGGTHLVFVRELDFQDVQTLFWGQEVRPT